MKKLIRVLCVALALSMVLAMPAYAQTAVESRASIFFAAYGAALFKNSSTSFEIWFDVDSNAARMDVIGVSEIIVYRSSNQQSWMEVLRFDMEDHPEMIDTYTYSHAGHVTVNHAMSGYYYMADVTFYAKDYRGVGERYVYTDILLM